MANIKSAKKRINVTIKKALRNKMIKSQTKTAIKKVAVAVQTGDRQDAAAKLISACSVIDKAAQKGIFHKNNAARKKSNLTKLVNKMA